MVAFFVPPPGGTIEPVYPSVATTVVTQSPGGIADSNPVLMDLPSGIQSGDRLVLVVGWFTGLGTGDITTPSGWSRVVGTAANDSPHVYTKIANGSEGSTVSITFSGLSGIYGMAYRITGAGAGIEGATKSTGSGTTATFPSLSPSWGAAKTLWIAIGWVNTNGTPNMPAPTSYSNRLSATIAGPIMSTSERQNNTGTEAPGSVNASSGGTTNWITALIGIQPSA